MCIDQLLELGGLPVALGYLYAVGLGHMLIRRVMEEMYGLVGHEPEQKYRWQPYVTGIIERTLYVTSFLSGYPIFVGAWLAFKVVGGKEAWSEREKGRAIYSNAFNGSALSLFYAGMGYLLILWVEKQFAYTVGLAFVLVVLTVVLWIFLHRERKRNDEKQRPFYEKVTRTSSKQIE